MKEGVKMKYDNILINLSNINHNFKQLTSDELSIIEMINKSPNLSEKKWCDILKTAQKSHSLLLALCYFENYNNRITHQLISVLPKNLLIHILHKKNINLIDVNYVCDNIQSSDLKDYIINDSEKISKIFKQKILNFNYTKSQEIDFLHYKFFKGINKQAKEAVEQYSTNEEFMTAISNNKHLDDKIRNDAFNNMHNPLHIDNYTSYMKMKMYQNAATRLFDYPQKSVSDIEKNEEAKEVILNIIEKKELPISCEYDLLQRLHDMPSLHYSGILLRSLLKNTHEPVILKKAYEFNPQSTENIVENNSCCDIFTMEKFIDKSIKKMKEYSKSNNLIPLLKEKDFIYEKIFNQPLSLESYRKIHNYTKTHDSLIDYAILVSPYINVNSIKDLFQNNKKQIVDFRKKMECCFAKQGLSESRCFDYLNFAVYCMFKNNETYFQLPQSLSLQHFFKHFGSPLSHISKDEMTIIKTLCNDLLQNEKWVEEFDKEIEKVYNIENEFGPYADLYSYYEGTLCFDVDKFTHLSEIDKTIFIQNVLNSNSLNSLETLQKSIETRLSYEPISAKTYYLINNIIDLYNKLFEKIADIEKTIEDREEII